MEVIEIDDDDSRFEFREAKPRKIVSTQERGRYMCFINTYTSIRCSALTFQLKCVKNWNLQQIRVLEIQIYITGFIFK